MAKYIIKGGYMASEGIYIKNIGNMQEQVSNINTYTDKLKRDMSNIRDTINAINNNWISEETDKLSIVNNLVDLESKFNDTIIVTLDEFIKSMNQLIDEAIRISKND